MIDSGCAFGGCGRAGDFAVLLHPDAPLIQLCVLHRRCAGGNVRNAYEHVGELSGAVWNDVAQVR